MRKLLILGCLLFGISYAHSDGFKTKDTDATRTTRRRYIVEYTTGTHRWTLLLDPLKDGTSFYQTENTNKVLDVNINHTNNSGTATKSTLYMDFLLVID